MKFLKIARRPRWYSDAFYADKPELSSKNFAEQFAAYCSDFFGPVDTWSHTMRNHNLDATDLICGVDNLDSAWWRDFREGKPFDADKVIYEQIRDHCPDVLFLEGIESFKPHEIERFRSLIGSDAVLAGLTGTDIRSNPSLYLVDIVFSCMKGLVKDLNDQKRNAVFLPHSFDPRILNHFPRQPEFTENLNFIGNFVGGNHMHDYRIHIVEALIRDSGLVVYTNYGTNKKKAWARHVVSAAAYRLSRPLRNFSKIHRYMPAKLQTAMKWKQAPAFNFSNTLAKAARPGGYGLAQYELLRRAPTTVNVHAGLAENFAANMRLYEATGIGVATLTDQKVDLAEFFEDGKEVIAYASIDEAKEKAAYLLDNPQIRSDIAKAGQKRTLNDHTFENRMPILLEGLEKFQGNSK